MEIDVLFLEHFWVPIRQSILKITLGMTLCENTLTNLILPENLFFVQFLNCSTQMKIVFCFLFCPVRHFTFVKCLPIKMSSWTRPHFFLASRAVTEIWEVYATQRFWVEKLLLWLCSIYFFGSIFIIFLGGLRCFMI